MPPEMIMAERYQLYATEVVEDVGFVTASLELGISLVSTACEDMVDTLMALKRAIGEICYEIAYSMAEFGNRIGLSR